MKNKKVVVTGGAGFIGSHLVDKLINMECKVRVVDNLSSGRLVNLENSFKKIEFFQLNLACLDQSELAQIFSDVDYVFHLAARADIIPSIKNPVSYFNANVVSTLNVLEACRSHGIAKLVYAASSSCYGIPENYPTSEDEVIDPRYPYALTKYLGEELVLHWGKIYSLPVVSLRFFNVYGPRARTSGSYGAVFGVFLAQKVAGCPLTIVGDGTQTRDFTYVSDIVSALIASLNSPVNCQVYNVGSGKAISVNRVAELIGGNKVYIQKRPGEPDCTFASINKIKADLNWAPEISIEVGVNEILRNLDQWKDAPVWTPKSISEATKDWFKYLKTQKNEI
jgi:UDP-glucose 4-epimerase